MPAKGQTCANCAGDCCSVVSFTRDQGPLLKDSVMNFTKRALTALGYVEVYKPHKLCTAKTTVGCAIYADRLPLCRSYYCHGKYWRPKD